MHPNPNYRRNRDYTKQFDWTYDLKKNAYNCYLRTKENSQVGYMNRLKNYWCKLHPQCNFLSDKNVRDQASCIEELRQLWEQDMELLQ